GAAAASSRTTPASALSVSVAPVAAVGDSLRRPCRRHADRDDALGPRCRDGGATRLVGGAARGRDAHQVLSARHRVRPLSSLGLEDAFGFLRRDGWPLWLLCVVWRRLAHLRLSARLCLRRGVRERPRRVYPDDFARRGATAPACHARLSGNRIRSDGDVVSTGTFTGSP